MDILGYITPLLLVILIVELGMIIVKLDSALKGPPIAR
jgi:hypothetical protein